MNKIKIEKNIPIPDTYRGITRQTVEAMESGDSIIVNSRSELSAWRSAVERAGYKAVSRKIENGSWRIWKTKVNDKKS
jgi:hypothetical protein